MYTVTYCEAHVRVIRIRSSDNQANILDQSPAITAPFGQEGLLTAVLLQHEYLTSLDRRIFDLSNRQASHLGYPLSLIIPGDPAKYYYMAGHVIRNNLGRELIKDFHGGILCPDVTIQVY
jgi:hypothetical protein